MDPIRQTETLVAILLASFEMQIQSLQLLDRNLMRPTLIHHTKSLISALLRSIEEIERQLLEHVESEADEALEQSASLTKIITEAKVVMPEAKMFQNLAQMAKSGHSSLTSSLAKEEQKVTDEVVERFKKMKSKTSQLLNQIEKI